MRHLLPLLMLAACSGKSSDDGTSTPDASDTDTDTDTDADADCDAPTAGPWKGHPIADAGATASYDPYSYDAGIGAVLGVMVPPEDTDGDGEDDYVTFVSGPHTITDAIITSIEFTPDPYDKDGLTFYVEDQAGPLVIYKAPVAVGQFASIVPGATVTVTADTAVDFYGTKEMSNITSLEVTGFDGTVHVVDINGSGGPIDYDLHNLHTIEVWGELVAGPEDCGLDCWTLDYGAGTIEARLVPDGFFLGDCVHYIGPMTRYFDQDQLDASDFDWARYY